MPDPVAAMSISPVVGSAKVTPVPVNVPETDVPFVMTGTGLGDDRQIVDGVY